MLIQQRQPFKEGWPNLWDLTAGGCAVAGESSQTAARRELWEEIGYRMDFENLRPHLTVNFPRSFVDYYLVEADVDLSQLRLQPEEVQNVKWTSREEILHMIDEQRFIPFYPSFISLLFEMRKSYGSQFQ